MTDHIHDDVDRALTAYGGRGFAYRTFGRFALRNGLPIVLEDVPAPVPQDAVAEGDTEHVVELVAAPVLPPIEEPVIPNPVAVEPASEKSDHAEPVLAEPIVAEESVAEEIVPEPEEAEAAADADARTELDMAPQTLAHDAATVMVDAVPESALPPELAADDPVPVVPMATWAQDDVAEPPKVITEVVEPEPPPEVAQFSMYPTDAPTRLAPPARMPPAPPSPPVRATPFPVHEMNIFQIAWEHTAAPLVDAERPRAAWPGDPEPLPGDRDLFRRL